MRSAISILRLQEKYHEQDEQNYAVFATLKIAFLTFVLLLSIRSFIVSPLYEIVALVEQAWLVFLVLFLSYSVCTGFIRKRYALDGFDTVILILASLPFLGAITSKIEYSQPLVHGILAFKDYYLFFSAYFIYYLLRNNVISFKQLEKAFMWAALISLIGFVGLSLFTNPGKYSDSIIAGSQASKGGGVYYRFNMGLIFYGLIYFFIRGIKYGKAKDYVLSFVFLSYVLFFRLDRTSMVASVFAMGVSWLLLASKTTQFKTIFYYLIPVIMLMSIVLMLKPDVWHTISTMFWDAISTLTGQNSGGGQAKLRKYEADIAITQIAEHPFFGNGRVSKTWVAGAFDHFYRFFYPSDVGLIGIIFIFGIFGTLLLYSQFSLVLITLYALRFKIKNTFALALIFFLLIIFTDSLSNGTLIIFSCQTVLAVMGIYYFYQRGQYELEDD